MQKNILFKNVDENYYKDMVSIVKYNQEALVFSEGEECDKIGILLSGEIKISTLAYDDSEYTIQILNKNDIYGDTLLFSNENYYLGDGITTMPTEVLYIRKNNLLKLLKNEQILENYLTIISSKITKINNRLKLFSQKSIEDRIMYYLLDEAKNNNSNLIKINGKDSIARILNIPRPSLSRGLINLKNKGLIEYNKYYIKLN